MKASYDKWRSRLAGEKVPTFTEPDDQDCGFYRLPEKVKQPNGRWKVIGYKPVALFVDDDSLKCRIGSQMAGEDQRNDAWTWFVQNPITEEVWRAVAEIGGAWPDFPAPADLSAEPSSIMPGQVVEVRASHLTQDGDIGNSLAPEQKIAAEIAAAEKDLAKFAKIESDEQSSKARSLQQRFLDARSYAAKAYEAANRPLLDAQNALRKVWFPLRDTADEASNTLRAAMGTWETQKREAERDRLAKEAEAVAKYQEQVRAAEAASKPAPPPPPPPPKPNIPAPSAQIKAPGARAASVKVETIVIDIDLDGAFAQFKAQPEVKALLMTLAQRAIKAGIAVPSATTKEESVVR